MDLPCGTRNFDYAKDMALFRTRTHWFLFTALIVIVFTLPFYLTNYWLSVLNLIGITIISCIGLNLLVGYCGQLSIGHAGFMAVGAYTSAILTGNFNIPFLIALVASGICAGLIGLIFGVPSIRIKGFYLAITTIAAQFIIIWIINHWSEVTGGFSGINVPYASIGGLVLKGQFKQYYLIITILVICIYIAKNISRSKIGRAFVAIRDNDLAAEVMGVNLLYYKMLAFFTGCFFAGIAGSLFAHWVGFISAENFHFADSILYIGMLIIGGLGTNIGPIFGVIIIQLIQQGIMFISPFTENIFTALPAGFTSGIGPMLFGLIIVLFLIFEPRGIAHRWSLLKASYRLWPFSY